MKAVIRSRGNIVFTNDYAKPVCGPKNLLVQVKAAGINPADYKFGWPITPTVVGTDFSGIIVEKGASVTENFKVGDEVYGNVAFSRNGSLVEFINTDPTCLALKPKTLSFAEAAVMPGVYLTAVQGFRDYGKMQSGDRVLIIGASGGSGTSAVQIAKALGASEIVGVCSGKNSDLVKSLGATEVVDYTKQTVQQFYQDEEGNVPEGMKFDVVYDAATNSGGGEDYKDSSMELLKNNGERHGQYVALNGYISMWLRLFTIGFKPNQHLFLCHPQKPGDLEYLAKLIDEHGVKPIIAADLPFDAESVEKGFDLQKSRRAVGKIVFHMDE